MSHTFTILPLKLIRDTDIANILVELIGQEHVSPLFYKFGFSDVVSVHLIEINGN